MFSIHLAVYQLNSFRYQLLNIRDKSKLACIAYMTKHTLSEENISQPDAIQSSYQFPILPGFGAVGESFFM